MEQTWLTVDTLLEPWKRLKKTIKTKVGDVCLPSSILWTKMAILIGTKYNQQPFNTGGSVGGWENLVSDSTKITPPLHMWKEYKPPFQMHKNNSTTLELIFYIHRNSIVFHETRPFITFCKNFFPWGRKKTPPPPLRQGSPKNPTTQILLTLPTVFPK